MERLSPGNCLQDKQAPDTAITTPSSGWFLFHRSGFLSREKGRTLPSLVGFCSSRDKKGAPTEVKDIQAITGGEKMLRSWVALQSSWMVLVQDQHTHMPTGTRQVT